ncbi:MAG: flagellar motor switch protein FliN [Thermodesulfobacteriota bacterium]
MPDKSLDDAWADALSDQSGGGKAAKGGDEWSVAMGGGSHAAEFEELGDGSAQQLGTQNLEFLLDVPLEVTVELGRSTMIVNRLLQLTQGSVVELDKAAGEPVDIYVNGKMMGKGEVIVLNERFGVRITEIISQADRVKNMG